MHYFISHFSYVLKFNEGQTVKYAKLTSYNSFGSFSLANNYNE